MVKVPPRKVLCWLTLMLLLQHAEPSSAQGSTAISSLEGEIKQLEAKIVRLEKEGASAVALRGARLRLEEKKRILAEERIRLSEDLQFRSMYLGNAQAADANVVVDAATKLLYSRDPFVTAIDISSYATGALIRVRGYVLLEHTRLGDRFVIVQDDHPAEDHCWNALDSNCYQPLTCVKEDNSFPVFSIWKAKAISQRDWDALQNNVERLCVRSKLHRSIYPDGSDMKDLHSVTVEGVLNADRLDLDLELEDWVVIRE